MQVEIRTGIFRQHKCDGADMPQYCSHAATGNTQQMSYTLANVKPSMLDGEFVYHECSIDYTLIAESNYLGN